MQLRFEVYFCGDRGNYFLLSFYKEGKKQIVFGMKPENLLRSLIDLTQNKNFYQCVALSSCFSGLLA